MYLHNHRGSHFPAVQCGWEDANLFSLCFPQVVTTSSNYFRVQKLQLIHREGGCCPAQGDQGKHAPAMHRHILHPTCCLQATAVPHLAHFWATPRSRLLQAHCFDLWLFKLFTRSPNNSFYWFGKNVKIYGEPQEEIKSGRKNWSECECHISEACSMNYGRFLILLGFQRKGGCFFF